MIDFMLPTATGFDCRWFVMQTAPGRELVVEDRLRRGRIETFPPWEKYFVRHADKDRPDRKAERRRALFPCYLFLLHKVGHYLCVDQIAANPFALDYIKGAEGKLLLVGVQRPRAYADRPGAGRRLRSNPALCRRPSRFQRWNVLKGRQRRPGSDPKTGGRNHHCRGGFNGREIKYGRNCALTQITAPWS